MFLATVLIVAVQTGVFAYAWFHDYYTKEVIGRMYGYWGHWALLVLYAVMVVLVSKLFSAFKVGYMRILDVILEQNFFRFQIGFRMPSCRVIEHDERSAQCFLLIPIDHTFVLGQLFPPLRVFIMDDLSGWGRDRI